ncbi:MAG: PhzF family phenazine biosynthesis protein [Actinomycetes bacterium]
MRLRYFTCDVFTDTRFGGNQLAVLPEAESLSDEQMRQVAREFAYSETTFVLPPRAGHDRRVRIFTPGGEVPFAGHPNIGTAFVLATMGALGPLEEPREVVFEEEAGLVPVAVRRLSGDRIWCELTAPQALTLGATVPVASAAAAACLTEADIVTTAHAPLVASVGLPFVMAELTGREALARARPDLAVFEALVAGGMEEPMLHLYVRSGDEFDIRARMFSPLDGIPEDAATGSANCALAGLLAHLDGAVDAELTWRIAQGVEMGRPSVLEARAEKRAGAVERVRIGGESVLVCEGLIEV